MKAGTRTLWTFVITSIALFMVVLDNLVVSTALPVIRVDLGASIEQLEWIGQRLHAHLRRLPPDRRRARRPLRPQADVHDRRRDLHRGASRARRARAVDRMAHRRTRRSGARRRDRDAAHADDPQRGRRRRPKRGARARRVVGHRRARRRDAARSSAAPSSRASPGSGSSGSTFPIGLVLLPLALRSCARRYGPDKALDLPGLALGERGPARDRLGPRARGNARRLDEPADRRRARRRRAAARRVRRLGAARPPQPMLPMRFFRNRAVRGRERRFAVHVLRDVRLDLPARAVLPDRAGLLAARVRPAHPALDGSCRCSSRRSPGRSPIAIGGRPLMALGPGAAGDRPRVDRVGDSTPTDAATASLVGPFIVVRHRDGACSSRPVANVVLSAVRPRRGGQGVRREQRDPRGRRQCSACAVLAVALRRATAGTSRPQTFAATGSWPRLWVGCRPVLAAGGSARLAVDPASAGSEAVPVPTPTGASWPEARGGVVRDARWGRTSWSDLSQPPLVPSPRDVARPHRVA